ncbi:MAG: M28 family peptidase, partial [Gemmatimonas sp.]
MRIHQAQRLSIFCASLAAVLLVPAAGCARSVARSAEQSPIALEVEREISGDRALATVAFVEQFFRLPGNRGFDASIDTVAALLDAAGYVREDRGTRTERFAYRIESRPMREPAWTPDSASLTLGGRTAPLLRFATNKNMIAINSYATPFGGVNAPMVAVGTGVDSVMARSNVRGKIVFGEGNARTVYTSAMKHGAAGVLFVQTLPAYNQQAKNTDAIGFSSVPRDTVNKGWLIFLSAAAADSVRGALAAGAATATVNISASFESRPERTIVAEIRGASKPDERFVYSAHVQEPGANDNASGVGLLAEMARVAASLVKSNRANPARTITFLWGDEIRATARYLAEDTARRAGVKWGMSLDMVGENTALTGGTFLIEKMPDPSAVWTRGADQHSEWGGRPIQVADIRAHWFNDFVRQRCLDRASRTGWVVKSNPFEGGSDHTPFLDAEIPAVLLWHFTDQFYHTDRDRLSMVSNATLANVGSCALTTGLMLAVGSTKVARNAIDELTRVAERTIATQAVLSDSALRAGSNAAKEQLVIATWRDFYVGALARVPDIAIEPV